MTREHVGRLRAFHDAFNAGGIDAASEHLHPDVVIDEPESLPFGGTYRGRPGFRSLVAAINEHFAASFESFTPHDAAEGAIATMELSFESRETGQRIVMPVVEIYEFTDGLISHVHVFYKDPVTIAALAEPSTSRSPLAWG